MGTSSIHLLELYPPLPARVLARRFHNLALLLHLFFLPHNPRLTSLLFLTPLRTPHPAPHILNIHTIHTPHHARNISIQLAPTNRQNKIRLRILRSLIIKQQSRAKPCLNSRLTNHPLLLIILRIELTNRPTPPLQRRIQPTEKPRQPRRRRIPLLTTLRLTQPLHSTNTNRRIKRARPERHPLPRIGKQQVPFDLFLQRDAQHRCADVEAYPYVRAAGRAFFNSLREDFAGEARAAAYVEDEGGGG